jgi:hypothetical protein
MDEKGHLVTKVSELIEQLGQFDIGDRVELEIYRNGISQTVSTVLGGGESRSTSSYNTSTTPLPSPRLWTDFGGMPKYKIRKLAHN